MDFQAQEDFKLVLQLMKNPTYRVPEHLREKLLRSAEDVLDSVYSKDTDKVSCMQVILACDRFNLDTIKMIMPRRSVQTVNKNVTKMSTKDIKQIVTDGLKALRDSGEPDANRGTDQLDNNDINDRPKRLEMVDVSRI